MLSNYLSICKSIKKYGKKKIVYKSSIFLKIIGNWYMTRFTWPRAVFLADINNNYIVLNEAISVFLPIIAIVDSNAKSYLVKFPIISNDDSIESFYFIFNIISKLIILLKYKKLILWFFKYKKIIKKVNLKKLINYLYFIKAVNIKKIFKPLNLFNKFNKNLKNIESFYKYYINLKFLNIFGKNNILNFDIIFLKKMLFFKKYSSLIRYKSSFLLKKKPKIAMSANIRKVLFFFNNFKKYKKNDGQILIKGRYNNVSKYFSLY